MKQRPINRRSFLRGAGMAISLPFMESLVPVAWGSNPEPARPKRLSVFYMPNGLRMPEYTPTIAGSGYEMTPILTPIEAYRERFTVISGLAHYNALALGDGPGSHGRSCAAYLTP